MANKKCIHDKQSYFCKECKAEGIGGKGICEHDRRKERCKDCKGSQICEHGRQRSICKECKGGSICEHNRIRSVCRECKGGSICEHGRKRSECKDCKGGSICEHDKVRSQCKDCKGGSICEHDKVRSQCKDCKGGSICEHDRMKSTCKECKGSDICKHGKRRQYCIPCEGSRTCKGHKETLCETLGNRKYRGYCCRCFQYYFPDEPVSKAYRTKEKVWVDFILQEFHNYKWTFNKTLNACSNYRPDAFLDLHTHAIFCENDEYQHEGYSCESRRMMALFEDVGNRPIVFIRFNPDNYMKGDQKITSCWGQDKNGNIRIKPSKVEEWANRLNTFADVLKHHIHTIPEKEVTVVELFYNQ